MPRFTIATCVLASVLLTSSASATVIGNLNIGTGGTATVTLSSLVFNNDPSANLFGNLGFIATGQVNSGTDLSFDGGPLNQNEGISMVGGAYITENRTRHLQDRRYFGLK